MCPWARYLVSIASLTWAHQGGIGCGRYYNLSDDKVCTWPIAFLSEEKWLWQFLDTIIIGSSALYPLAKGAIQMLIIIIYCYYSRGTEQYFKIFFLARFHFSGKNWLQGCSQSHSLGWARVPLSSFFLQILIIFSYFSSNFSHFLPHFDPPGRRLAHPRRPWLRHWLIAYLQMQKEEFKHSF